MMLGDLGADVIKVENPDGGDETRQWGPPYTEGEAAYYLSLNRNKRGITVNLKTDEGRQIVRRLAARADILVENFKTGTLDRLGLGYDTLREDNPRLIFCSITGFGQTGPDREQPGYDFAMQGRGGVMSVTGHPDGEPTKVGPAIVDVTAALNATVSILAAVEQRHRTGQGQRCDIALLDSQVAWLMHFAANYLVGGLEPQRMGNTNPNIVPYQTFRASDRWFNLTVGNDGQFRRFAQAIGRPELAEDERFRTNPKRVEHREILVPMLAEVFAQRTAAEWLALFNAEKIPCGPINTIPEVFADQQVLARGMLVEMAHPKAGSVKLVGSPLKLSESPVRYERHPPLLGEHTEEVLQELGYDAGAVDALRRGGVV